MDGLIYEVDKNGELRAKTPNGIQLGVFICGLDGYFEFWPEPSRPGYWPTWFLRDLADKTDSLNFAWEMRIKNETVPLNNTKESKTI